MRRSFVCSLLGSFVCALVLAPRSASATSCAPSIVQVVPADAEVLPVNSRPLGAVSCGGDLSGWEVDIDGQPGAVFVQDPGFGYGMLSSIGIAPAPQPGAMVVLRGCSEGCWSDETERDVLRTYTVGAADFTAPAAPALLELRFADEIVSQYDWQTDQEHRVAVRHWTLAFEPPGLPEPVAWEIEVGPGGSAASSKTALIVGPRDEAVVVTRYESDAGEQVCGRARALDLAGNASVVTEVCVQLGEDQTLPDVPGSDDDEPEGETGTGGDEGGGDDVAGGDDSSGEGGVAQGDRTAGGCSVARGGRGQGGAAALLGLVVLGLGRRRR
ncbi:MAG: hypothetical protein AB1Z98_03100 [Nannocystaceae bacterium]